MAEREIKMVVCVYVYKMADVQLHKANLCVCEYKMAACVYEYKMATAHAWFNDGGRAIAQGYFVYVIAEDYFIWVN